MNDNDFVEKQDEPYVFRNDFVSGLWEVKVNEICKKTHGYEHRDWSIVTVEEMTDKIE